MTGRDSGTTLDQAQVLARNSLHCHGQPVESGWFRTGELLKSSLQNPSVPPPTLDHVSLHVVPAVNLLVATRVRALDHLAGVHAVVVTPRVALERKRLLSRRARVLLGVRQE